MDRLLTLETPAAAAAPTRQVVEVMPRRPRPGPDGRLSHSEDTLRFTKAELATAQTNYNAVYSLAPVGYVTVYQDTIIREINGSAARLLGRQRIEMLGSPLVIYVKPGCRQGVLDHFRKVFASGDDTIEVVLCRSTGQDFPARIHSTLIRDSSARNHYCLCSLTDLTEPLTANRRLRQQQDHVARLEEANIRLQRERTELASSASDMQKRLHEHEVALEACRRQIGQLQGELHGKTDRLEETTHRLTEITADREVVETQLLARRGELERLLASQAEELQAVRDELARQNREHDRIRQQLQAEMERAVAAKEQEILGLHDVNSQLQQQLADGRQVERKLAWRVEQFRGLLHRQNEALAAARARMEETVLQNQRIEEALTAKQAEHALAMAEHSQRAGSLELVLAHP